MTREVPETFERGTEHQGVSYRDRPRPHSRLGDSWWGVQPPSVRRQRHLSRLGMKIGLHYDARNDNDATAPSMVLLVGEGVAGVPMAGR